MGCNCGSKKAGIAYRVDFANGDPDQTYDTISEAVTALKAAGNPAGSSFKAVSK